MRILHLDSGREMRGGQWQALRLHRGLLAAGHHSMLFARRESPLLKAALNEQLPCVELSAFRLGSESRGFDLVHAHDARSHTLAALFSRVPFVVSRRVAFPVRNSLTSRWKYGRPRLFLAVSRHVAGELMRAGVSESRIAVVYDGVPVPPVAARGDAVLAPRTLDPQKGMALAEEGAKLARVPMEISDNLEADLPGARALVYLSHSEGLGSGILLAMAHGVTVIASNTGGIPELIEHGVTGILVANNAQAVAAALRNIDPSLGLAARREVLERFTETHMVQATLQAYRGALKNV